MTEIQEPETGSMIDNASAAARRLEQANKEYKALLDRQEALQARALLGGKSEAGKPQEQPKEETPIEYKNKIMKGIVKNG